jgi:hypothetical protein
VEDRKVVHEERAGNVVIEIYEKYSPDNTKVYYDMRYVRSYYANEEERRSPNIQQRDGLDIIKATAEALQWISHQHRVRRGVTED